MKERVRQWALPWLVRHETVPIARCVHYGAFRYGCGAFNPYENYAKAFAAGGDVGEARARFIDFLQHYRPADFGAALGIALSRRHPLWSFPWAHPPAEKPGVAGWFDAPEDVPDILTHFSPSGIPRARIEEEFAWLERALTSIRAQGYQPGRFTGHIEARKLVAADGGARYLITDGNHRLSALSALGQESVVIRYRWRMTAHEAGLTRWPQVAAGLFSPEDARRVFRAYFEGNERVRTTAVPAEVLEAAATRHP